MAAISEYPLTNTGAEVQTAIDDALTTLPYQIGLKANLSDVLTKTNTTAWTPTGNYQPATKLYVDTVRPTVTVGTTTTGAEGTNASVTNSGTARDAILNFTIPRGNTGAAAGFGTPTATANTLTPGSSATASVTASGSATSKVFAFTFGIPQGIQGIQGEQGFYVNRIARTSGSGSPGTTDTYTMYLNDLAETAMGTFNVYNGSNGLPNTLSIGSVTSGSSPSVTITGESPNQTLNFVLQKGDTGSQGVQGERGYFVNNVVRTSGTGAAGTTDTYTMYINDTGATAIGTFNVYNGADGLGAGDMLKSVYDINNNNIVDGAESLHDSTSQVWFELS